MKKLILVLAIALIASPAFALNVYLSRVGDSNVIDVNYSGADADNLPRAFALDIAIMSGNAKFYDVTNYQQGESNSTNPRYGIYPARIIINTDGDEVNEWGGPLADPCDAGAGALGTNRVVLEFASLYTGDGNAPATSGKLCSLIVQLNGQTTSFDVNMVDEDTYRGGLVFEDGTQGEVDANIIYSMGPPLPGKATSPSPADAATGVSRTTTLSWTAGSDATSHDVYFGRELPLSSKGIQTATTFDPCTGTLTQGQVYYWRIDEMNVTGTTTGDQWSFTVEECYKSSGGNYATWVALGKPKCYCYKKHCRGDANGSATLGKRITSTDFNTWKAGYNKTVTQLKGQVDGAGVPQICGDFNHSTTLSKPITSTDFNTWKTYYNLADSSVPICASTNINFWTN